MARHLASPARPKHPFRLHSQVYPTTYRLLIMLEILPKMAAIRVLVTSLGESPSEQISG